ncbi:hypothetical protein CSB93_6364 [Pseudomonas paraeruginosa]|uniref:Uncharacterized protein n=1 Tax=Pseudomonas paraeruginosa TaxID=2994495 RepID=A0A2R3IY25_9PSED|nr:hypothetical protein CSB93_6364 [Pseudomonas paraeruginosa]AWE92277.1 hypothetical protein CSC28_5167 [Pseudomonas paraeruginosa]
MEGCGALLEVKEMTKHNKSKVLGFELKVIYQEWGPFAFTTDG